MLLKLSHFFSPLYPPALYLILFSMSLGHTYKFFGFYISYTILNLPLSSAYHLCFLFPVSLPPFSPAPFPLIILHVIPISVILFLF